MTREECVQKAKDIMINKNPYGIYHKYNFDTYNYGEMTPINSETINNMPNATIILSDKVYGSLQAIQDVTNKEDKEVPFFYMGEKLLIIQLNLMIFLQIVTEIIDKVQEQFLIRL